MKTVQPHSLGHLASVACIALLMLCCAGLRAQELTNHALSQLKDSAFFQSAEAQRIGNLLLLYQRDTGGWPKNTEMVTPLSDAQQDSVRRQKARQDDSTIDNKATIMQMRFLAHLFRQTGDSRYRSAFCRGMGFLLSGQYENGGWPQFWPLNRGYQKHITFNDDAMVNVLSLLHDVIRERPAYGADLIDEQMRKRASEAFERGIGCILATQIMFRGRPAIWCQQYDCSTLLPAQARSYELPSFCTQESAAIVSLLMQIDQPDERVVRSVHSAMRWFDEHKLLGCRLERYSVGGQPDIRLAADSCAEPIWARFYDLEEGLPFVCDRDGQPKHSLSEISYERRNGYSWYNGKPRALFRQYEVWAQRTGGPQAP